MDLEATKITELTGLNRNTVNRYLMGIRKKIARFCEKESPFGGIVEVDESYFGPKRIKGKRGRGAGSKTIVFGIFKCNGKVYTEIAPNARKKTLQRIIRKRINPETAIHSDGWRSYDGLVDIGYDKHFRVNHGDNEFAKDGHIHINGIENFWSFTKRRLAQFNGVKKNFELHLKESEWRYGKSFATMKIDLWNIYKSYLNQ